MSRVRQRAAARLDLVEAMAHLAERSPDAARRFRREAQATFDRLAAMPGMGARYAADDPAHSDLRYFPVSKSATTWSFTARRRTASRSCGCCTGREISERF